MTTIDELFKASSASGSKRKAAIANNPDAIYKATKLSANGDVKSNGRATVEDDNVDDLEAGPELPPDEDGPEDEEGRFFGGGITTDTADVLNFIDERDKDGLGKEQNIDTAWLRKTALNFEKKISKNAELRVKFEQNPQKFMGSEADLDADIKALSILSEHPELYADFVELGCVASLVSLLSHENTDIAIDAIEVINELTDEYVEAEQSQWDALVDALLEADLTDLLFENLERMDESNQSDRTGVYHILSVIENLSSRVPLAEMIAEETSMISWLLSRIQRPETVVSQNKQYSAEVLTVLLQSSVANRSLLLQQDGIDVFLQLLSAYRKRDPAKGSDEEEYVENLFDCITCCVDGVDGKQKLLDAEGIELCVIMLKEGKMSRPRALRLLDHALAGVNGAPCCERLVEAAGLKAVFSLLMKKHDNETTEHLLGILTSMFRSLPADSASRIRLLAKFVEKDYEKIERLVQIRREYMSRVSFVEQGITQEKDELSSNEQADKEDIWLSRRLNAGLFSLQAVDVILAWLVAEDEGAKIKVQNALADRDETLLDIRVTLEDQLNSMNAGADDEDLVVKDILGTLLSYLH